ncbi:hypothetical protein BJ508DRAFT_131075 [Ascobolus immersus RN42]|uniref:Uncharacterized protein n=1 Tax=Ascobolus immersus RN42 TaxID=1160509 RepID=A0A3N4I653_ASCIM|nr:hypothetical protein BJ508DRAFT_131075 [Ascobolus immersus RN42]
MSLIQYLQEAWVAIVHGITKPVPILMALFDGHLPFSTIFYNPQKASQSSITTQEKPQLEGRMDLWEPELEMDTVEVPALGDDIPLYEKLEKIDALNIDMPYKRAILLASDQAHKVLVFGFVALVVMLWMVYLRKQHVAAKKAKSEPSEALKKLLRDDENRWEKSETQPEIEQEAQTITPPDSQAESQADSQSESKSSVSKSSVSRAIPSKQRMTANRTSLDDIVMIDSVLETDNSVEVDTSIQDIEMEDAEGRDVRSGSVMSIDTPDDAADVAAASSFTMLPLAKDLDFTEEAPVALAGGVATLSLENDDDNGINSPRKKPVRRLPQLARRKERVIENLAAGDDNDDSEIGEDIPMDFEASSAPPLASPVA